MLNAYTTTPCKDYDLNPIITELKKKLIGSVREVGTDNDRFSKATKTALDNRAIILVDPKDTITRQFNHAINISGTYFLDIRPYSKLGRLEELTITNVGELEFHALRAAVEYEQARDSNYGMKRLAPVMVKFFARWISNAISAKKNLNIEANTNIYIIAAEYILNLIEGREEKDFDDLESTALRLSRVLRVDAEEILRVIEKTSDAKDVKMMLENIREFGGSTQLKDISLNLFYAYIQGIWFGNNHRETIAVAVEHPATLATMIYCSQASHIFSRTMVGQIIKRQFKSDEVDSFLTTYQDIIRGGY